MISLPSFPASDKRKDLRYKWFSRTFGDQCWELDAMDPNDLRRRVEFSINALIEQEAWQRFMTVNKAERDSLRSTLLAWSGRQ